MNKNTNTPTLKLQAPRNPKALLSVQEARQLLNTAWSFGPIPCAAYFILRTWGGLRDVEVRNLDIAHDLSLENGCVMANNQRGHLRRVKLAPNVIKMLRILQADGQLTPAALNPPAHTVAKAMGKGVGRTSHNLLRATAMIYHFAQHQNLALTCSWAGNSVATHSHHYSPVRMKDAAAFWALLPDGVA